MYRFFLTIVLSVCCTSTLSCGYFDSAEQDIQDIIVVKIPPAFNPNLTTGENQCLFSEFLFPGDTERDVNTTCKNAGLVNFDGLLEVSLRNDGSLQLNTEATGDLSNTEILRNRLLDIFNSRTENGVFEEGSNKVVKAVGIEIPTSAKYSDLIQVAKAVKESGANPIVLLLDGHLPYQPVKINN